MTTRSSRSGLWMAQETKTQKPTRFVFLEQAMDVDQKRCLLVARRTRHGFRIRIDSLGGRDGCVQTQKKERRETIRAEIQTKNPVFENGNREGLQQMGCRDTNAIGFESGRDLHGTQR